MTSIERPYASVTLVGILTDIFRRIAAKFGTAELIIRTESGGQGEKRMEVHVTTPTWKGTFSRPST